MRWPQEVDSTSRRLATLQVGPGSQLVPLAGPIALRRLGDKEEPALGLIRPDAPDYDGYAALLRAAIADDFARLYALEDRLLTA